MTVAELTLHLYDLHPMQQRIRTEAKRFNVWAAGRRTGKTTLSEDLVVETVLDDRAPFGLFAPNYPTLEKNWRDLRTLLAPVTRRTSESSHRLEVLGGGELECWSLGNEGVADTARGRKYKRIGVEEAGSVVGLLDHWQKVIRPMLADYRGDGWLWGTPKGLNDFYTLWLRGQDPEESEWKSWRCPTSENPFISPEEIEAARRESSEQAFSQEWMAEFVADGTGVFRGVLAACRSTAQTQPQAGHQYVFGVDWGRVNDFTVLSVIDATTREQVHVERFNQIDYYVQKSRLAILAQRFRPQLIVAEANAMGAPNIEDLQRLGLPVWSWTATNASKASAVEGLALAIERGDLSILADQVQTGELLAYQAERLPSGMVRYSAPEGMHDDTVVALSLAWLAACTPSSRPKAHTFRVEA